jgi:hypothetical protein
MLGAYGLNSCMRFFEFNPQKPLTPPQARIAALKKNVEVTKQALARERRSQQIQKAQSKIKKLSALNISP